MAQLNDLIVTGSSRFINDVTATQVRSVVNQSTLYGTGTAATTSGSNYIPAKWTFNTGQTVADGDSIFITMPVAGHSYGVFLSINNGTNYYPVNIYDSTRLTTHYPVNTILHLVFDADGSTQSIFPVAGGASRVTVSGGCWRVVNFYDSDSNTIPSAYCDTAASTAAKVASCSAYALLDKSYVHVLMRYANTSASAITLNINSAGAKSIYINGTASSSSNYTLPAGTYLVYYASNIYYFRTDGKLTADITGNAATATSASKLSNTSKVGDTNKPVYFTASGVPAAISYTIDKSVPSTAVFTDANLTQTATNTNANYEVLFSATADNTTRTEGARKYSNLLFNPSTGNLQATQLNGVNIGSSPKFTDTTYTFANGTNGFTVTPSGGSAQTVKVTPSITNNVTGSGTSGYIAKWNGTNTITNGPAFGSATTTYLRNDGSWATPADSTKLPLAGGTMTGQIKTSFKSSVAMGSYGSDVTSIDHLANELRYSSGAAGSFNLLTTYTKGSVSITGGWYNFLWIPHRSGGVDGAASSDNCDHGQLILYGMTTSGAYYLRFSSGSIQECKAIVNTDYLFEKAVTRTSFDFTFNSTTSGKWYCALYRSYNETVCWRGILTVSAQTYSYTPGYSQSFIVAISYRDIRLIPIESNSYYVDWITNWRVGQNSSGDTMYLDFQCTTLSSPYSNPFKLTIIDLSGRYDTRTIPTALAASQVSTVQYTVANSSLFTPSISLVT